MEGINRHDEPADGALVELNLIGTLRASADGERNLLPGLRKAGALFVILALSDGQSVTRRFLAGLLWSRSDPAQALARLRDTLRTLRQSIHDALGETDLIRMVGDRIALKPGAVKVDLSAADDRGDSLMFNWSEVAADLDALDPALDDWLTGVRARLRERSHAGVPGRERSPAVGNASAPKRGSVIGVWMLNGIGMQSDEPLSFALAEEIATSLARIRGLMVISSGSVAVAMAGQRNLREELGLDFLLEGALQRVGERLRVTIKLVDAGTSMVCWTSRFEYEHDDLFHVQQDVAALVAAGLEPELPTIAAEQIRRAGVGAGGAYELILRAIGRIHLLDRRSFMEAGELLREAIELEPEYSPAYSWLALWNAFLVGQGWARDPRASITRAGEAAEHAVTLDPNDARALAVAGHVRAYLHRRLDEAMALHERALAINPSLPLAWHFSGVAFAYAGDLDEARRRLERCRRLAPQDPHSFYAEGAFIIVELLSRNHAAAATIGRRVTLLHPRFTAAYKPYLAALGHLGERKEAQIVYRRLLQLEPDFTIRAFRATAPFAQREQLEHYVAGLGLAGVP